MAIESLTRAPLRADGSYPVDAKRAPDFQRMLANVREGDEHAFAALWRALNPALVRYLRVLSGETSDDLAAETWLHVIRGVDRFEGDDAGFRSWIFTIARHRHLDWCRVRARQPQLVSTEIDSDTPSAHGDPAGSAEVADSTARALDLIAQLPREQAEVITLRVVADLDVAQVARIMKKRPGTVRVLSHRGLRRLGELIEQRGITDDL